MNHNQMNKIIFAFSHIFFEQVHEHYADVSMKWMIVFRPVAEMTVIVKYVNRSVAIMVVMRT